MIYHYNGGFKIRINNKLIMLCLIICIVCMISSVAASDTNSTDNQALSTADTVTLDDVSDSENNEVLKSVNNDSAEETLSVESDNEKLGASSIDVTTFSQLSSAISNSAYSEINIKKDIVLTNSLSISRNNIVINGNGNIINGQNTYRFFATSEGVNYITLKNIIIKNAKSPSDQDTNHWQSGGGVFFYKGSHCVVDNCTFINCYSSYGGGAVYFSEGSTYNTITNCYFKDNSALCSGGAIRIRTTGGLKSTNNLIKNSYFENNVAGLDTQRGGSGGAIEFYTSDSTLDNCTFIKNTIKSSPDLSFGACGGAVELYEYSTGNEFKNSIFINNTAPKAYGGAFAVNKESSSNTKLSNCTFIGNSALDGGAIYFNAANSNINYCIFENNTATDKGGAVFSNAENLKVYRCTFKNCSALSCNYFYQGETIDFDETYFPEVYVGNDNAAGDSLDPNSLGKFSTAMALVETGGTMYIVGSLTNFQNHEVTRAITIKPYTTSSNINLASVSGRAFTISASDVTIRDLTITGSKYNGNGGVLYWNGDNAYIYNCTFQNNVLSSYTSSGKGGVIYVTGNSDIFTVEKCTFQNNRAYDGGAIYVDDVTDNTLIYNSIFSGDYATHYGGALYYEGSICYYVDENTNRDFSGNFAGGDSLYANIYDGEATKCILDVYVSLNGDGDGSTFNTPTNFKNGFKLVAPNGKLTFVRENEIFNLGEDYRISKFNVTFIGNHSTLNDASFTITTTSHDIKFYNLIFTGNSEYTIIWNGVDGIVENCIFKDNGGNNGLKGVAIQAYGDNLQVKNSIFNNNRALSNGADGGAIWCNATNLKIINSNFTNNKASAGGIHVYLAESATYTIIKDSSFINGTRTGTGSAIILTNGTIMITSSVFEKNSGVYGGALRLLNGIATVNASTFTSNEATTYGGAIYSNVPLTLTYSNFTRNQADYGGAVYLSGTGNSLTNLIFERNVAKVGSAIYFNTSDDITFKKIKFTANTATEDATVYFTSNCNVYNDENVIFTGNILPDASSLNVVVPNGVKINPNVYYVSNTGGGTGLTWGNDATTLDYALSHVFEGGKIIFSQDTYEFENAIIISQNIVLVGNQTILKRKDSNNDKFLFILQDGVVLNISNITLNAGIDAVSGSELNLDNVIFTGTGANDGGIIYEAGSSGSIVNSNFTGVTNLMDSHIVTVNGNVDINNTEFSSNSLTGSALYYSNAGTGSISNSVFTDNAASGDVRNINIADISKVTLSSNTFDVNVTYMITNSTYGSEASINGTFDAGVNFNINNIMLIVNDTGKTNTTVSINPTTNAFSFDVSGKLAVGKYNLTVNNNDANKYKVNYLSDNFEVNKACITINPVSDIAVSYGDNDTITITGSITNNINYGRNYTGNVSVVIANNDAVNATVNENGVFTVNVNVKAFNKGVYALNITVLGNNNYTGVTKKFDSYLTVEDANIAITGIESITVDYGADYVIVNGTLNSTRFGANYNGNITVNIAGLSNKTQALNGKFSVRITNSTPFRAGRYDIVASGEAVSNYNSIATYTLTEGLVVNGIEPEFIISSPSIGYGENATVYIILPDDATGKVVIEVEGGEIKTIENIYGIKNVTFGILPSGSYKVNATYFGDNNYLQVEVNSTLFVERPRTKLNISVVDTFVGNDVLINFTINSAVTGELFRDAGGSLRIYVGGDVYQLNVTNGKANLSISDLSIAGYNVIVIYSGDDNYAGCDGYSKFNVNGRETGLNITLNADEVLVGSNVIVTVNVDEEIDNDPVYLYIDEKLYNILLTTKGVVIFNVSGLAYGVHNITAIFTATSVFGAATNSTLVSIIKNNPNFNPEVVADGDRNVFVKFTLPDDATGEVNITYDGTVIKTVAVTRSSQTVQLDDIYPAGTYTFTMTYSGDDKYYNASVCDSVEVGKISDYEMNITSSIILRDQDVTIYVNLPSEFANNGTVNLTINGTLYSNMPLVNGCVNQTVHTVGLDTIEVVAVYSGYDDYASKTVSKVFTVGQISEYDINIDVGTAYVGDSVVINITAPVQFDNVNFTITINGVKDNVSIINGSGNYTVNSVSLGYYEVSVTSVENKYYVAKTETGGFDVIKRTPQLNIMDIPSEVYVKGKFNITVENNLKGDAWIILYVDGVKKAEKLWSDNNFTIEGLSSGYHIITVSSKENDYYYSNTNSTTVNALKLDSSVSAHVDGIEVGENLIVNITASGNGSATIYIYDESGSYIGEFILSIKNGEGQIIVPYKFTEIGHYTINITYNGDDIYNVSKNSADFLVNLATDYIFKVITTDAYVGDDIIVNVTLPNNANKDVTLTLPNGTNITKVAVDGITSFTISNITAGDYTVNATYAGDNNYARGTKMGKFSVYRHDSTIDLRFNTTGSDLEVISSIVQGEKTTLIIQLPDDCKGYVNVTVTDTIHFNNQVLTDGKVTIALNDLTYGNYNIKVDYSGDDKYNNATGSIVLIVASSKPSIEILPISTQVVGSNVNVSVRTDADKGNITLYMNGVKVETVNVLSGWANFTINNISGEASTVNVFVVYEANSQYAGAFNSTTFDVTKYSTTIDAVCDVNNITVKVLPGVTGSVIVTFNGVNFTSQVNSSGVAVISLPKVPGTYNLPVYYAGDSRYYSNSTMVEVNIPWGDDYTLNATVNSTGYVTINIDSKANNVTINWDGSTPVTLDLTPDADIKVAHYQLPDDLSVGSHIVVVSYAGDDNLGPKSYSLIYNVAKVTDYLFNITADSISVGSPAVIVVNLPDDATGFVVFTVNGEGYSINLADSRNLTLTGLGNGTYNVVAKYLGNDNYDISENTTTFKVDKLNVVLELNETVIEIGDSLCVLVKFNNNLANAVGEIEVNGDKFPVVNGMAFIPASKLPAVAGLYTIDVKYLGGDVYNETNILTLDYEIIKVADVVITVPGNVTIDQVLNISVDGANDGKLNITIDDGALFTVDVVNGIASIPVEKLPQISGSHNINVTYWNGSVFADKEVNTVFYSDKITGYSFTITNSTIKFGENATLEINLPSDVTTTLTVKINNVDKTVDIVGGYGKLENVSGLHAGVNTVSAVFGSDKYETSTATAAVQVNPNDITLEIIFPAEQLYVSQSATVTVRANVSMNNNVTLYINGKAESVELTNGEGSFTIDPLSYGEYVFTAIFNGNENYTYTAASEKSFSVDKNNVTLNVTTDNVIVGHDVNIKVNINGDATGLVIVKINNVDYSLNITNHEFDVAVANLANGTYTIVAIYYGDDKYYGFENTTNVEVLKLTPTITADETILVGEDLIITVENATSLVGNATGKLKLTIDGFGAVEADVINGKAVIKANDLPQVNGTYSASVNYYGDSNYYSLIKEISFTVNKVSDVVITVPSNVTIDEVLNISVGDNTTGGKLNVTIGTDAMFTVDVVNGIAVIPVSKLPQVSGNYDIKVSYWNGSYWGDKEVITTFHADKITDYIFIISEDTVKFGQNATLTISLPGDVNTVLTVKINGVEKTVEIINGNGELENINNLHAGVNDVVSTFGSDKYETSTATSTIQVNPNDIALEIIVPSEQLYVDQSATVAVRANVSMNNNVTVYVNGVARSLKLNNGEGSFTINPLVYGRYVFTAVFDGNENYTYAAASEKSFNVDKNNVALNVTTDNVIVGHDVNIKVNIDGDATGLVIVKINNNEYSLNITNKEYTLSVPNLGNGTYSIVAVYYGDDKYYGFENTTVVEVLKLTPSISANDTILIGEDLVITVENATSLVGKATGKLNLTIDGFGTVVADVINGVAVIKASELPQVNNTYTASVEYYGDNNYYGLTQAIAFTITKVPSLIITVPGNVTIDEELIIAVGDSTTDGKLNVTIGNGNEFTVDVINGTATIPVSELPQVSGNYNISVYYYGGSYWGNVEYNTTFHADKITVYPFNISSPTIRFGENATLEINLPSDVTTTLTVTINDVDKTVDITGGYGKLENISNLHAKANSVSAVFGSDKYETRTAVSTIQVDPNDITLTIIVPTEQLYVDESATVTVRANVSMNNNVTVYVNGKAQSLKLNNGEGSFTIAPLVYGDYVFTAVFDGNENYTYTTASEKSFSVDKNNITINVTSSNVVVGHDVNIKVNINDDATGLVIVKVDNAEYSLNLDNKEYSLVVSGLGNGTHNIVAKYYGDSKYYGDENTTTVDVLKLVPVITVSSEVLIGEDLTISIANSSSLVANPGGKLKFTIDGYDAVEIEVTNGVGIIKGSMLPQVDNTYTATVEYSGDENYYNLTETVSFKIDKDPGLIIAVPSNVTIDEELVISVGDDTTDGKLNVTIGNGEKFTVPVVNGTAVIPVKYLPQVSNLYAITLDYYGGSYWNDYSVVRSFHEDKITNYTFDITNDTIRFNDVATIRFTLPSDVNTTLTVLIDDIVRYVKVTNGYGVLGISGLHAGVNIVTTSFGSGKYETSTAASFIRVLATEISLDIIVPVEQLYVGNSATITVQANVSMNNSVTLYVNGKAETLNLTNGQANYTINPLVYGEYVFTAIFNGNENYTYATADEKVFNVDKNNVTLNVTTANVLVGHDVNIKVNINSDATGLVIVKINNVDYSLNITNKEYALSVSDLGNGTYNIVAVYYGDDKYYGFENTTGVEVLKLTPSISADSSILVGEDLTIVVENATSLVGNATGKLDLTIDGFGSVEADVINGVAVIKASELPQVNNTYTASVNYYGDNNYYALVQAIEFSVNKVAGVLITVPSNVTIDDELIIGVGDSTTGGKLNVTIGDGDVFTVDVVNGTAVIPVDKLPQVSDDYNIKVSYWNGSYWDDKEISAVFHADKISVYDFIISDDTVKFGQNATLTITLPADVNTTLNVKINGADKSVNIANGHGVLENINGLHAGVNTVESTFTSDKYESSTATSTIQVNPNDITLTIIVPTEQLYVGQSATVAVRANVSMNNNVTVYVNGKAQSLKLNDGEGSFTISPLVYGEYVFTAIFNGNENYTYATASEKSFSVDKNNVDLSVSSSDVVVGHSIVINVDINDDATGLVIVKVDNAEYSLNLDNKQYSLEVSGLGSGTHNIVAKYYGDSKYYDDEDTTSVDVLKLVPEITLSSEGFVDEDLTVSISNSSSLVANPTGKLKFTVDGYDTIEIDVIDGVAIVKGSMLPQVANNYTVSVVYSGDDNYAPSESTFDIELIRSDSFRALQMLIDSADENSTIVLDKDYTYDPATDGDGGIIVNKPVTINGMGHMMDAKGTSPVFDITADDVNIFNITYANANGTVIDVNADNVVIANSSFVNNTVENGSLINASGVNGTTLSGNDFINNNLTNATAIDVSGSSDSNITDTTFEGNDVTNSTLIDASNTTDADVSGTDLSDNNMVDSTGIDVSGSTDANVNGTTASGNDVAGGSIVDASNSTGVDVSGTDLSGNNLTDTTGVDVSGSSDSNITDTTFEGNDVTNSTLIDASNSTDADVSGTDLSDNNMVDSTGVDVSGSDGASVDGTTASGNDVTGGSIVDASNSSGVGVSGTDLSGNNMTDTTGVDVSGSEGASVEDTTASGNDVTGGKVVDASGSNGTDVSGTDLSDNTMNNSTGVDVSGSTGASVEDTTASGNDVTGGSIVDASDSTGAGVSGTDLSDNSMVDSTGVDVSGSTDANVNGTTASGNDISGGSVVDASGSSGVDVSGTDLSDNVLTNVTGVDVSGSEGASVENTTSVNNEIDGGTIVDTNGSDAKVDPVNETGDRYAPYMAFENNTVARGADLVIDLSEDATGNVTVTIGDITKTVPVSGGKAVISTSDIPAGVYNITASYGGDSKYYDKDINAIVNITADDNIKVSAPDVVKYYHSPERFYVYVSDDKGNPIANKTVAITINGVSYSRITNANGTASLAINLNCGVYNAIVDVEGNGTCYATVTVLPTVNGTDVVKVFRNGTHYWATFRDSNGDYLAEGSAVQFNIHGVIYTRYVSGNEGMAKLNINLEQGEYIVTATNLVTGESCSNNILVVSLIVENNDLVKYYRNASQFRVKVIDASGKSSSGLKVTFNVNGVFYTRTTDADGYAALNINLQPGDYIITSEYGGCRVANNIKVLPVLSASDLTKKYGTPNQFVATVLNGQGRPYAGQTVTFNVNGVLYDRVTDSDGNAKLNINLQAGKYIITSSYKGTNVANTIIVTA